MHLHVAQADVDNCFHRMRMRAEMQRWFSLPRISAANLGGVRIGDGFLNDDTHIFPLLETLPMGFSWSLFFAQSAHEAIVEEHTGLTGGDRLTDFAPGRRLKSGGIAHLQYVDNFAALGGDPASLTQVKEGVRQVMGTRGLLMREHEDAGKGVAELLGHTIKAIEGTISISPKRAWRSRDACCTLHVCGICLEWPLRLSWNTLVSAFGATMSVVSVWEGVRLCAGALQGASSVVAVSATRT